MVLYVDEFGTFTPAHPVAYDFDDCNDYGYVDYDYANGTREDEYMMSFQLV